MKYFTLRGTFHLKQNYEATAIAESNYEDECLYRFCLSFCFTQKYLKEYHYLSPLKNGNHNFRDALRMFQQNSDIPETGLLDAKTITEMHKPRCGVPDFDEVGSSINSGEDMMGCCG